MFPPDALSSPVTIADAPEVPENGPLIVIVGEVKYPDPVGLPEVAFVGQGRIDATCPVTPATSPGEDASPVVLIIAKVLEAADFPEFVNAGLCSVVSATMYVPFAN